MDDSVSSPTDPETKRLAALPVSVLSDVVDRLGYRTQAMAHVVRPVFSETASLAGRAFTISATASTTILDNPYEHELAAVDATPPGAVVVLATGGCLDAAVWGELLMARTLARGGTGVVTDGGIRDLAGIRRFAVPAFAAGVTPRDSMGRVLVTGWNEPVSCAGVMVHPGDLVRGDEDGVVVVPHAVAEEALAAAEAKLGLEELVRLALERGESAAELYERHGVL